MKRTIEINLEATIDSDNNTITVAIGECEGIEVVDVMTAVQEAYNSLHNKLVLIRQHHGLDGKGMLPILELSAGQICKMAEEVTKG